MANTFIVYSDVDGSTVDFAFTFPYIATAHVKVGVDGVTQATTEYTVVESPSTKVTFTTPPASGTTVTVFRDTATDTLPVDFTDGSILTEADLDKNFNTLLYASQEFVEATSISLDATKTKWNADGKVLDSLLAGTSGDSAVTLDQLTEVALFGSYVVPQTWSFTTTTSGQTEFVLDSTSGDGDPSGTNDNFFIVDEGGVVQDPNNDFNITESNGIFKCVLATGLSEANVPVTVRNFGISRQYLEQPLLSKTTSSVALTLKALAGQTAEMLLMKDSADAQIFTVNSDGSMEVGGTSASTNTRITSTSMEMGDVDTGSASGKGFLINMLDDETTVVVQGDSDTVSENALRVFDGSTKRFEVKYDGATECGDLTCVDVTASGRVDIGGGIGDTGATIESDGDIKTDGNVISGGFYAKDSDGLRVNDPANQSDRGNFYFSSTGPLMEFWDAGGGTGISVKAAETQIEVAGGPLDVGSQKITSLATPTLGTDAATKAYVDTGRWLFIADLTLDETGWASISSGYASYDRVRLVLENLKPDDGDTSSVFLMELVQSDGTTREQFINSGLADAYYNNCLTAHTNGELEVAPGELNDYVANPGSGEITINRLKSAQTPVDVDVFFQSAAIDGNSSVNGKAITENANPSVDRMRITFGDNAGATIHGITGTVKVYGFNYPTS